MKKSYVLITGASSGIGEIFAIQFAKRGYPLILTARREDRLLSLKKKLKTPVVLVEADLSRQSDREKLITAIQPYDIGILINNAGFGDCGEFVKTDLKKEMDMIEVNIKTVHYLTKKILPDMVRRNSGCILNVASSAGLCPAGPYMAAYYASKAYVASFTRAIADELQKKGTNVYVGCLCPGPVNTEFNSVANVKFALKGISPEYCVRYALKQMQKRKTVIVPTLTMKLALLFTRLIPSRLAVYMIARQQKKKLYRK